MPLTWEVLKAKDGTTECPVKNFVHWGQRERESGPEICISARERIYPGHGRECSSGHASTVKLGKRDGTVRREAGAAWL